MKSAPFLIILEVNYHLISSNIKSLKSLKTIYNVNPEKIFASLCVRIRSCHNR